MLKEAQQNNFPTEKFDQLQAVILARPNAFWTPFSAGPPANVPPLKIQLKPNSKPTIVRLRRYTAEHQEFLDKLMNKLIELDYVYPNPTSKWGSTPHLVAKSVPSRWRFTGDLREINRWTVAEKFPMPVIDQELEKARNAKFFADFDLTHG